MSKTKKAILITILTIVMLTVLIFEIILLCLGNATLPRREIIYYDELQALLKDNIVYISDKFIQENNLDIVAIYSGWYNGEPVGDIIGEVSIGYNGIPQMDWSDHALVAKNLGGVSYSFRSKQEDDKIPIEMEVNIFIRNSKDAEYAYEYGAFKYAILNSSVNNKEYSIKAKPRKRGRCQLKLNIAIKEDVADKYSEEEKNARIEQIFKSAIDNIVLYQG